jgi:hypothetical protein
MGGDRWNVRDAIIAAAPGKVSPFPDLEFGRDGRASPSARLSFTIANAKLTPLARG